MVYRTVLFTAAAWLLGAHFLRFGHLAWVVLCVCTPLLFLVRKRWVLWLLQLLAYGAAATWVVVAVRLVQERLAAGQPWHLAAAILGGVTLFTVLAGVLLNSRQARERYPR